MLILYTAMKYDYGKKEQGYSFDHYNFYSSLVNMGHDILYFDYMTLIEQYGREGMNRRLLEIAFNEKPALMFTALFRDEIDATTIDTLSQKSDTVTLNWFTDDHWRFDNFSRLWAPHFNWVVTTANSALPKYAQIGYKNVVKSQWACNSYLYRKLDVPLKYEVTFVGQPHGNRREIIEKLRSAGINVQVWGTGWEAGRLTQDEMITVFNQSRINLNLSNASMPLVTLSWQGKLKRLIAHTLDAVPMGKSLKRLAREQGVTDAILSAPPKSLDTPDQIKGRNFEIPGCGGMQLSGVAENLGDYYKIGQEIACFDTPDDLVEKVRYYLQHEDERAAIAEAGYRRTLQEHTYVQRFNEIFRAIGLPQDAQTRPGQTVEIS